MTRNLAGWDRAVRLLVGAALVALVFVGPQTPWGWVGLVPIVTALAGFCPAYRLLGLSSCPVGRRRSPPKGA